MASMNHRLSMRVSTGESGIRVLPEMFKHRLLQLAEETVDSLQQIWKEAGYEEIECQRLLGDLLAKLKTTCSNELAAEQQILEHAKGEAENSIKEYIHLNEQLGRTVNVDYLANMNLTDRLTELDRILEAINTEVSGRQKIFDQELNSINSLTKALGEQAATEANFRGPAGTPTLSDLRLQLMIDYKSDLEIQKNKRMEEIKNLAKECYVHMCDLMYAEEGYSTMKDSESCLQMDKQIVKFAKTFEFTLGLTKKDLSAITLRLNSFLEEKERRRTELAKTGEEIAKLWTVLRIPSAEREQFQNSFKKNLSMETLNKGFEELKRLKETRRRSFGRVITSIRDDIQALWEEAGIESEDNRKSEFSMFYQDVEILEDSAIESHEAYFNTLRTRVEQLKPILLKISRRETIIQERIELEHLQLNPERLTARGPNAREERKREEAMATRVKNIDKITKEIISQIASWEETNGPFIYAGERYLDRIPKQDEQYFEIRDNLRNSRKRKDGKDTKADTMTKSISAKKTSTIPATPFSSSKSRSGDYHGLLITPAPPSVPSLAVSALNSSMEPSENLPPVPNMLDRCSSSDSTSTLVKERDSNSSITVVTSQNYM